MPQGFTFEEALQEPEKKPYSFVESMTPELSYHPVTLPDYLNQPDRRVETQFDLGEVVPYGNIPGPQPQWRSEPPAPEATIPESLNAAALGAGAGVLQEAAPGLAKVAGTFAEMMPGFGPEEIVPPERTQEELARLQRSPAKLSRDIQSNPAYQAGEVAKQFWEQKIPRTEAEKQNILAKGAEQAAAMVPYFLYAPAAPALIAAQSFSDHIVNDYEQLKQNLGEEEAGKVAMGNAFAAGALQGAVFEFLPKPLRAAGEKFILDKFGKGVLSEFLAKRAASTAQTSALFGTSAAAEDVASGRTPSLESVGVGAESGAIFGVLSPYGAYRRKAAPAAPPEVRAQRKAALTARLEQLGIEHESMPGELPGPEGQVAHANKQGKVIISDENFHRQVEQEVADGVSPEEAVESIATEEIFHAVRKKMPGGRQIAVDFWRALTPLERWIVKRRYHGEDYTGVKLTDEQYGDEALRFALQRARHLQPGELIFGKRGEILKSHALTALGDAISWVRKNWRGGTESYKKQIGLLDQLDANVKQAEEGAKNASSEQEAAEVHGDVQPQPEQGQGQVSAAEGGEGVQSPAQGVAEAAQVSLTPNPNLPKWLNERMIQEGKDPNRPLNEIDITNPSIRDAIQTDPTLTEEQKQSLLKTGQMVEPLKRKPTAKQQARVEAKMKRGEPLSAKEQQVWDYFNKIEPEIPKETTGKKDRKKAPPSAQTGEAQKEQAPAVSQTAPPGAATPGVPAATSTISPSFPESKMRRLEELNSAITAEGAKFDKSKYDEWVALSKELDSAEAAAGAGPKRQGNEPSGTEMSAMTRKPDEIAKELGLEYRGTLRGRDQYVKQSKDESGMSGITITVPEGSSREDVFNKMVQRSQDYSSMTRKFDAIRDMSVKELRAAYPRGFNPENWEIGESATPEVVTELKSHRDALSKEAADIVESVKTRPATGEEMNRLNEISFINQYFSEAVQAAPKDVGGEGRVFAGAEERARVRAQREAEESSSAMTRKGAGQGSPELSEEDVAGSLVRAVGGVGNDHQKMAIIEDAYNQIVSQDKAHWPTLLTEFQSKWKAREMEIAYEKMKGGAAMTPEEEAAFKAAIDQGMEWAQRLSPENIAAKFGLADRQVAYRGALAVLSQAPVPAKTITQPSEPKLLPKEGEPVNKAVTPRYYVGDYKEFWQDFHERHPHVPEQAARDVWTEAVYDFLHNASPDVIKRLLRPAKLEKRFLGNMPAPQPGEPDMRRIIPDVDPDPIVNEMAKAPSPTDAVAFKKFAAARDLTPEQAKEALQKLRDRTTQEMKEIKGSMEMAKPDVLGPKEKTRSMQREEPGEGELTQLEKERELGRKANMERRRKAIGALAEWLIEPSKPPGADINRRAITDQDIWFEVKKQGMFPYIEFTPSEGTDKSYLVKVLGKGGSVGKKEDTRTRSIGIFIDPKTGNYHALSIYVRDGIPRVYEPDSYAGDKTKGYVDLNEVLPRFRAVAHILLRDPVYKFHQMWVTDKQSTGQDKFKAAIGDEANRREVSSPQELRKYLLDIEEEKRKEKERLRKERFFGETKEEEITGQEEDVPETTAEQEKAAETEEPTTSREEELSKRVREQVARDREAAGLKPWEEGEEWDPEMLKGRQSGLTREAIDAWQAAVSTGKELRYMSGRQAVKHYDTDLSRVIEHPITTGELDSLHVLMRFLNIRNPFDWEKSLQWADKKISATEKRVAGLADVIRLLRNGRVTGDDVRGLYALDKIANKIYERLSSYRSEREKVAGLPEIPKDTPYADMDAGQKEHYEILEARKYRALMLTFNELHELVTSTKSAGERSQKASAKGIAVPEDAIAFRTAAMDRYGDKARRQLEDSAAQAQRAAEQSGQRTILAGSKFGGTPRTRAEVLASYPQKFPRPAGLPQEMMSKAEASHVAGQAKTQFAYIPTAPEYQKPLLTPKGAEGESVPDYGMSGYRDRGFVPRGESYREMRDRLLKSFNAEPDNPAAMTRKGVGVAEAYRREMAEQGRTGYRRKEEEPYNTEELIRRGRELVISGQINPEKEMLQAERTGYISEDSTPAFRYWDYRLVSAANDALERAKGNMDDPAFREMMKVSDAWYERMRQTSHRMFNRTGKALQGWNQMGPNDMRNTVFVRRMLKRARAEERGLEEDEYELTDEDEGYVKKLTGRAAKEEDIRKGLEMKLGQEIAKAVDPPLDPGQQKLVGKAEQQSKKVRESALDILRRTRPEGSSMARKVKSIKLPLLDPVQLDALGNLGMDVMNQLAKRNQLTDQAWMDEMRKVLKENDRPDLEPYLPHVRAVSEEIRNVFLNNIIGTGSSVTDARKIFTRKRPPIEESIAALRRANEADPSGRNITPAEAFHMWSYIKTRFIDKGVLDFKTIRTQTAMELGIDQLRIFRALSANRSMRTVKDDLVKAMRNEARIKGQAMNWLKNQQYSRWLRGVRMFPRLFFWDKIMGHGLVPMITHAPTMIFNPAAWSVYFGKYKNGKFQPGAWHEMYRMTFGEQPLRRLAAKAGIGEWKGMTGEDYHRIQMEELTEHENFEKWRRVGLELDPFKYTDDYQIEALENVLGPKLKWLLGGRGFDALKTLRLAFAEKWLGSLPEHLRNKESMKLIADSVNHATGIVKTKLPGAVGEAMTWTMFAPKLELSRWAMGKDLIKAGDIMRKWSSASMEERAWAKAEIKQKLWMVGMYYGMLAVNQAFLWMSGSNQKINVTDPTKPDFMQAKVHGFRIGLASPIIGMFRMLSNLYHAAQGERTKFEKLDSRQKQIGKTLWSYGRGKMSPVASFATDMLTQEDYATRKLPWSDEVPTRRQRLEGVEPYSKTEYLAATFSPIPLEEAIRETFKSMDMPESEITKILRTMTIAGSMAATGARVAHDTSD